MTNVVSCNTAAAELYYMYSGCIRMMASLVYIRTYYSLWKQLAWLNNPLHPFCTTAAGNKNRWVWRLLMVTALPVDAMVNIWNMHILFYIHRINKQSHEEIIE